MGSPFGFCLISSVVAYLYTTSSDDDLMVHMVIQSFGTVKLDVMIYYSQIVNQKRGLKSNYNVKLHVT